MSPPHPNPIVEELAQKRFRLESLAEAQSAELRKDMPKYLESYERIQEGFAQPQDDAEKLKNVKLMEDICAQTPTSIDDRTRIVFAAHGLLMYLVRLDMNEQPMSTQLQVLKRTLELHREVLPSLADADLSQYLLKLDRELLSRPSAPMTTRPVTAADLENFKSDPLKIVGMSFIDPDDDQGGLYQVAELGYSKEGKWYQVQFEGCADFVQIDGEEMMEMVKDSVLLV